MDSNRHPYDCVLNQCDTTPCGHSSFSTNADYRADFADMINDCARYDKIWALYNQYKTKLFEETECFAFELARCQRIHDNWNTIQREVQDSKDTYAEESGFKTARNTSYSPAKIRDIDAKMALVIKEVCKKRTEILAAYSAT